MQQSTDSLEPSLETTLPANSTDQPESGTAARERAFGTWPKVEDGLAYQERLRSEWEGHVNE
jgi:hypothetical protein